MQPQPMVAICWEKMARAPHETEPLGHLPGHLAELGGRKSLWGRENENIFPECSPRKEFVGKKQNNQPHDPDFGFPKPPCHISWTQSFSKSGPVAVPGPQVDAWAVAPGDAPDAQN